MTLITPAAVKVDTVTLIANPGPSGNLRAGEALLAGAPCTIASDGDVELSDGTAANAAAAVHGFTVKDYAIGEEVTLAAPGTRFRYAAGMTPGDQLFLGATAGRLDDTATTGDTLGIAYALSATDIVFTNTKLIGA